MSDQEEKELTEAEEKELAELDAITQEYRAFMHGMQTGVALMMQHNPSETSPKHLRVGINSALSDQGALSKLLIQKGIITEREYLEAIRAGAKREKEHYEEALRSLGIVANLL